MSRPIVPAYSQLKLLASVVLGTLMGIFVIPVPDTTFNQPDASSIPQMKPFPVYVNKPLLCRDDSACNPNNCVEKLAKAKTAVEQHYELPPNNVHVKKFMELVRECTPVPLSKLKKSKFGDINQNLLVSNNITL